LLNHEIFPVEHLDLGLVLSLLEQRKQVGHLLVDVVFLNEDVAFLLGELGRHIAGHHARLGAV